MKRLALTALMLAAAGFFHARAVSATQPFTPCETVHCVTIGFCHTACVGCTGPIGNKKCEQPE
jgi:hypothetical protein